MRRNLCPQRAAGTVTKVHEGAVNNEVVLKLVGGSELTPIVTRETAIGWD